MSQMVKLWDNYEEIGIVYKTPKVRFVIYAATRDGVRNVGAQEQVYRAKLDVWRNTFHSMMIPLHWPIEDLHPFAEVMELFAKAQPVAETMELADEDKEVWYERKDR